MKKLADLKGARALNKIEQQSVNGGGRLKPGGGGGCCDPAIDCCVPNDGAPRPQCPPPTGSANCTFLYSYQTTNSPYTSCCF